MPKPRPDIGVAIANALLPVAHELLQLGERHGWQPQSGSPLEQEAAETRTRYGSDPKFKHPLEVLPQIVFARCWALSDYLRGVALIAAQGWQLQRHVVLSASPVARGALEAAAYMYWLTETGITAEERATRLVLDVHYAIKARNRLYDHRPDHLEDWDPGWADLAEMLDAWQIPNRRHEQPPHQVILELGRNRADAFSILAPLMPSKTGQVGPFFYSDITDLAHASTEGILRRSRISTEPDGSLKFEFSREEQLRALVALPWVLPQPLRAMCTTFGWDTDRIETTLTSTFERLAEQTSRGEPPTASQ